MKDGISTGVFRPYASEIVKVTLPHTWNAGDGMFGNADYYRGLCNYSRKLSVPAHYRGKRFFLKVMAAQTVADIFIDHYFVMQHKGGYTAFVAELTDFLVGKRKCIGNSCQQCSDYGYRSHLR